MVKNKALPDSAPPVWSLSLSLSLADLGPIKASLTCLLSLSPTPFILRVPPGSCRGWTPAVSHAPGEQGICPHVAALRAMGKSVQRDEVGRISDVLEYIR